MTIDFKKLYETHSSNFHLRIIFITSFTLLKHFIYHNIINSPIEENFPNTGENIHDKSNFSLEVLMIFTFFFKMLYDTLYRGFRNIQKKICKNNVEIYVNLRKIYFLY